MKELVRTYAEGILAAIIASLIFSLPLAFCLLEGKEMKAAAGGVRSIDIPVRTDAQETALAGLFRSAEAEARAEEISLQVGEPAYLDTLFTTDNKTEEFVLQSIAGPEGEPVEAEEKKGRYCFTPLVSGPYTVDIMIRNRLGRFHYVRGVFLANQPSVFGGGGL